MDMDTDTDTDTDKDASTDSKHENASVDGQVDAAQAALHAEYDRTYRIYAAVHDAHRRHQVDHKCSPKFLEYDVARRQRWMRGWMSKIVQVQAEMEAWAATATDPQPPRPPLPSYWSLQAQLEAQSRWQSESQSEPELLLHPELPVPLLSMPSALPFPLQALATSQDTAMLSNLWETREKCRQRIAQEQATVNQLQATIASYSKPCPEEQALYGDLEYMLAKVDELEEKLAF
jgi:hypothetical protein